MFSKKVHSEPTLDDFLSGILEPTSAEDIPNGDSTYRELASEGVLDDDPIDSIMYHMQPMVYDTYKTIQSDVDTLDCCRFYQFDYEKNGLQILDYLLSAIENKQLCLSPVNFNDAIDPLLSVYSNLRYKESLGKERKWYSFLNKLTDCFRICCVCPDRVKIGGKTIPAEEHQLMWSHYTKSHQGLCVKYRLKTNHMFRDDERNTFRIIKRVKYQDKKLSSTGITLTDSLLLKSSQWSYENEYRIIMFSPELMDGTKYPAIDKVEILGVYLGVKMPQRIKDYIIPKLKKMDVPIWYMKIDNNDIMNIKANRILQ